MVVNRLIILIVASLLLITTTVVADLIPDDTSFVTSSNEWMVANGSDRVTISVYALNNSTPLPGIQVNFDVNNSIFGTFSPQTVLTNSEGKAQSTFTVGKKSGTALLYSNLSYDLDGAPNIKSLDLLQKIDHSTPFRISVYDYDYRVEVGNITTMALTFTDEWGNPVDNRRNAEEVNFTIVSSPSSYPSEKRAGFIQGFDIVQTILVPVDGQGIARVDIKIDEVPGLNKIGISPLMYHPSGAKAIADSELTIEGIPGTPFRIAAAFAPSDFKQVADGEKVFQITYTLWDQYDNLVQNRSVSVTTSIPGEARNLRSNSEGQVILTYGPKSSIGRIMITATSLDNTSVTHTQEVIFVSTDPVDMHFTASPQTMPSRDVPGRQSVWLLATVVDEKGNPVNETVQVTFGIQPGSIRYDKDDYVITDNPGFKLSGAEVQEATVDTNIYGTAQLEFLPGGFTNNQSHDNFTASATGRCTVTATWGNVTRYIPLVWKNYPYLSLEAWASSNLVEVGDTIDITVKLTGDGWAIRPPPIDAVLVVDVSGSMTGTDVPPTRMHAARNAAKEFVSNMDMSPGRDRVALFSFSSDVYFDQGLTSDQYQMNSSIDGLSATGGTIMRKAYFEAIRYLKENGRDNAIKAVIVMGDGDWNAHGSPLAKGIGFPDTDTRLSTWDLTHYNSGIAVSSYPWNCYATPGYTFNPGPCKVRDTDGGTDYYVAGDFYEGYEWYSGLPADKGNLSVQKYWYRRYNPAGSYNRWRQGWVCLDGQFTNQNMSVYATSGDEHNRVKVYTIGFASNLDDNVEADLSVLSSATGGWYQWAGDEEALSTLYTQIAGELKIDAGVNTSSLFNYENIIVNHTSPVPNDGEDLIFDYVYSVGNSTRVDSYFTDDTVITIPGLPWHFDNTTQWEATKRLEIFLGTVRLNQVWEIKYRLQAMKEGVYNLFGPNSTITFEGETDPLVFPNLVLKVNPMIPGGGVEGNDLRYIRLEQDTSGDNKDLFLAVTINSTYIGTSDTVREKYTIITESYTRYPFGGLLMSKNAANEQRQFRVSRESLPLGVIEFEAEMEADDIGPEIKKIRLSMNSSRGHFTLY